MKLNSNPKLISLSALGIIPEPFEWLYISSGLAVLKYPPYNLTPTLSKNVSGFFIAKYPITNQQFQIYINDTNSQPKSDLFNNPKFNRENQPAIDLLWQEAVEFCNWINIKAPYNVRLPSDAEWQRAAQGNDNRKYPWGNQWDSRYCNIAESKFGVTTPVDKYPEGASPFGVMDLVGNCFEWCSTDSKTGQNHELKDSSEELDSYLFNQERIFKGSSFSTPIKQTAIDKYGSIQIIYPYLTGIRLVAIPRE